MSNFYTVSAMPYPPSSPNPSTIQAVLAITERNLKFVRFELANLFPTSAENGNITPLEASLRRKLARAEANHLEARQRVASISADAEAINRRLGHAQPPRPTPIPPSGVTTR